MKITKRQLKRIIKEEKSCILSEQQSAATNALGTLHDAIDTLITVLGAEEAYSELSGIVEDWHANYGAAEDDDAAWESEERLRNMGGW